MNSSATCNLTVILCVCVGLLCSSARGQEQLPFLGTWKLDTKDIESQMKKSGVDASLVKQRIARLQQMRWIFGNGKLITIRDGFPDSRTWKLRTSQDDTFHLRFKRGEEVEDVVVKMDGPKRMRLEFPGANATKFKLTWESDQQTLVEPNELMVGSKAPMIHVKHWMSESHFSGRFTTGNVYLLEFWATWCPPCIKGMVDLARLRDEFPGDKVVIVAVSSEREDVVKRFLERTLPGEDPKSGSRTFAEITTRISVGADPDGSTLRDYMVASKLRAIPMSFIVGKTGRVEWIGTPQRAAKVLQRVADDGWDRNEFAVVFAGHQRVYAALPTLSSLVSKGQREKARRLIEELLPLADETTKKSLQKLQEQIAKQEREK